MGDFDLADFSAAVRERAPGWEVVGIQWRFEVGPMRGKSAAWVVCENARHGAQLTVWTSGEAELDVVDFTTGNVTGVHYDLAASTVLAHCLDGVMVR